MTTKSKNLTDDNQPETAQDAQRDLTHIAAYLRETSAPQTLVNRLMAVSQFIKTNSTAPASTAELAAAQRHTYASIANSMTGKHRDEKHTEYVTLADAEAAVRAASDRKSVLLKAAYDLLAKQRDSGYVLNLLQETAFYDDADCDGYCLMEEIADELGIDTDAQA
jgi:hypothetical protein